MNLNNTYYYNLILSELFSFIRKPSKLNLFGKVQFNYGEFEKFTKHTVVVDFFNLITMQTTHKAMLEDKYVKYLSVIIKKIRDERIRYLKVNDKLKQESLEEIDEILRVLSAKEISFDDKLKVILKIDSNFSFEKVKVKLKNVNKIKRKTKAILTLFFVLSSTQVYAEDFNINNLSITFAGASHHSYKPIDPKTGKTINYKFNEKNDVIGFNYSFNDLEMFENEFDLKMGLSFYKDSWRQNATAITATLFPKNWQFEFQKDISIKFGGMALITNKATGFDIVDEKKIFNRKTLAGVVPVVEFQMQNIIFDFAVIPREEGVLTTANVSYQFQ